jgi:hypothetical protein
VKVLTFICRANPNIKPMTNNKTESIEDLAETYLQCRKMILVRPTWYQVRNAYQDGAAARDEHYREVISALEEAIEDLYETALVDYHGDSESEKALKYAEKRVAKSRAALQNVKPLTTMSEKQFSREEQEEAQQRNDFLELADMVIRYFTSEGKSPTLIDLASKAYVCKTPLSSNFEPANPPSSSSGEEEIKEDWELAHFCCKQCYDKATPEEIQRVRLTHTRLQSQQAEEIRYSADDMKNAFDAGFVESSKRRETGGVQYSGAKFWLASYQPSAPTPDKNREI